MARSCISQLLPLCFQLTEEVATQGKGVGQRQTDTLENREGGREQILKVLNQVKLEQA